MKKLSLILLFSLGALSAFAQQRITLDLQQTIALANDSSLEAFRTKNMYLAGYWEYRTYKANRLPSLTLNMTPAQYNRDITKRYDSEQDLDIYRSQQSFYAYGNLAVRQNFDLTGGTFYLDTELGYMRSFGGNKYTQFTSVPVRLGYSQSLVGYNPFRWERRIEPLKYEKVKKEYIYNAERVSEQATTYFFALAMAQAEYDLAKDNAVSTDTLYRIGMQRLKIAAISRADLLTLKLDVVNARNTLQNAASALKRAMFSLASFLNMEKNTDIRVSLPGRPRALTIPVDEALLAAQANNPEFLGLRQEVLEAEQTVDKTKKESRFNASINASVGFNQVAEKFGEAYRHPMQQEMVSVSVSIPLVDWGVRKGKYNMARNNLNVVKTSARQSEISIEEEVIMTVSDFNVQQALVASAEEALDLAILAYNETRQRFIIGKADINSLTLSLNRQQEAQRNYISALQDYWLNYYKIRKLTLHDFASGFSLSENLIIITDETSFFLHRHSGVCLPCFGRGGVDTAAPRQAESVTQPARLHGGFQHAWHFVAGGGDGSDQQAGIHAGAYPRSEAAELHLGQRLRQHYCGAGQACRCRGSPLRSFHHHPADVAPIARRCQLSHHSHESARRERLTPLHVLHPERPLHPDIDSAVCRGAYQAAAGKYSGYL